MVYTFIVWLVIIFAITSCCAALPTLITLFLLLFNFKQQAESFESFVSYLQRCIRRLPQPMINRHDAIEIAIRWYQVIDKNYYPDRASILSYDGLCHWKIVLKIGRPGLCIEIDNQTGEITKKYK